jgi:hypothetical protein
VIFGYKISSKAYNNFKEGSAIKTKINPGNRVQRNSNRDE